MKQIRTWIEPISCERQEQILLLDGRAAAIILLLW